jgi:hypothetical protein
LDELVAGTNGRSDVNQLGVGGGKRGGTAGGHAGINRGSDFREGDFRGGKQSRFAGATAM